MTPTALLRASRLLGRFRHQQTLAHAPKLDYITEADVRLNQLRYLLRRFRAVDRRAEVSYRALWPKGVKDRAGHARRATGVHELGDQVELYGEAFYFFAWRLKGALSQVPGFSTFDPVGVRDVRNHLIEHAEGRKRGVMARSFMFNCPQGFVLKPHGGGPGRVVDKGLYPNAEELLTDLLTRLRPLVTRPPRRRRRRTRE
jgi:hypothetical protein